MAEPLRLNRTARVTGLLYLVIIICAGFAEGYVRGTLVVPGDAAATATNIIASESLFRLGLVGDLIAFLCDAAVSVLLYVLLLPVDKTLSLLAAAFRLIAHPAIAAINLVNHFAALYLLRGSGIGAAFDTGQLHEIAMFFLDLHGTGYLIAGAFFGVHLLLLGYLLVRSGYMPRVLGVLVVVAGLGYLIDSFGTFLTPGFQQLYAWIVGVTAVAGEVSLCLWLLVKGVKAAR